MMNLIKLAVAAGTVLMSVGVWGQPIDCAIFVNGQRLQKVRSAEGLLFRGSDFEFNASALNEKRVKVTIQSSRLKHDGFLIGAFHNGRLNMSPDIHGQHVSVTCIQK
jgi:hypothetical protein